MKNLRLAALAATMTFAVASQAAVLFTDNFETDTTNKWLVTRNTELGLNYSLDSSATFNFDYGSSFEGVIIPSADGVLGTTKGLMLLVNSDPAETLTIEAITCCPNIARLSGDYSITFDMFFAFNAGNTTMHALSGLGHDGYTPFLQNVTASTGSTAYGVTPDGSSTTDYRVWLEKAVQTTAAGGGYLAAGTTFRNNSNALYTAMLPSIPTPAGNAVLNTVAGAPGLQWVTVQARRVGGAWTWSMKPQGAAAFTDIATLPTSGDGLPMVGFIDTAPSPRATSTYVVIDNVVVEGTDSGKRVTGKCVLKDYDTALGIDRSAEFQFKDGAGTITTVKGGLAADGSFEVNAPTNEPYQVRIKGKHWLAKIVSVDTTGGNALNSVNVALTNADIDGDNTVSILDYSVLSDYFDLDITVAGWKSVPTNGNGFAPRDADIDGDNAVTILDYSVLSDNFDLTGDEF